MPALCRHGRTATAVRGHRRSGRRIAASYPEVFADGYFVARLDVGYDERPVAVELDGAQHWPDPRQRTRDIDRRAELDALG